MSVNEPLAQAKAGFDAKVPAKAQEAIRRHIGEQRQSGLVFGLKEGDRAPDFSLTDPLGGTVTLYNELAEGPVVLVFYRGSWCPFCNIQLRAFEQALPDIRKHGGRLMAVSPQRPDHSLSQKEKENLTFQVLSDPDGRVAESYKLLFEMPDYLQQAFKHTLGRDLAEFNDTERWVLPVPATYLIDKAGIVRHAHVDPDFMERMEPREIIDLLMKL